MLGLDPHPVAGIATRNDTASTARIPGIVQRAWRSRTARRFDRLVTRGMRDRARRVLSLSPQRPDPDIGPDLRAAAADRLAEDAAAFRALSGLPFETWRV